MVSGFQQPSMGTDGHGLRDGQARDDDPRCLVVMYHYVHDDNPLPRPRPTGQTEGIRALSCATFQAQVDQLCRVLEPIDWPTLYAWFQGRGSIPRRCFLLTFDDGLADHAHQVLPILQKDGLRGVFFVPGSVLATHYLLPAHAVHLLLSTLGDETLERELLRYLARQETGIDWMTSMDTVSAEAMYHYESPERARLKYLLTVMLPPALRNAAVDALFEKHVGSSARWAKHWYLGWDEMIQMQSQGHTLGGHGQSHEPYTRFTPAGRRDDLRQVASLLRHGLGPDIRPFSYPYGLFDKDTCTACRESGFAHAFTTQRGWVTKESQVMQLPRVDTMDVDQVLNEEFACHLREPKV